LFLVSFSNVSLQHFTTDLCDSIMNSDTDSISQYTPSASSENSYDGGDSFYDPQGYRCSSQDSYLDHLDRLDCSLCNPLRFRDSDIAFAQQYHFPSITYIESEHADFRASARAKQRQRKIRENRSGCNSYRCRKMEQARQDTVNLQKKREDLKWAVRESQKDVLCYRQTNWKKPRDYFWKWDTQLEEETDEQEHDLEDDIGWYITVRRGADAIDREEPYVETGESFAIWCQKEDRIRRGKSLSSRQMVWRRKHDWQYGRSHDVYTGDEKTTTLPTTAYDALSHELLRFMLQTEHRWTRRQGVSNGSLFRLTNGYQWFGDFEWEWRRNMSGCWEVGYGSCRICDEHQTDTSVSCPRCCAIGGSEYYESFCREDRCFPAPEETQKGSLIEWVGQEGRDTIRLEEAREEARLHTSQDDTDVSDIDTDCSWEMFSSASSEGWSVLSR
jgi:hypothetical protein